VIAVAHDQHRNIAKIKGSIGTGFSELAREAGNEGHSFEDAVHLKLPTVGVDIVRRRELGDRIG